MAVNSAAIFFVSFFRMAHPTSGFYVKDDHEYVSVSSILGRTSEIFDPHKAKGLEFWRRNEPDWEDVVQRAQRRGKIIHAEIEGDLLGWGTKGHEDEATYEEIMIYNIHEYINYLSPILEEIKTENKHEEKDALKDDFCLEGVLHCPHGYAGTADARFWWQNQYTIWDWKTVRSHKEFEEEGKGKKTKSKSKYKEAFLQIGAYALAHNIAVKNGELDTLITQGVICVCYDWREPQLHILDRAELGQAVQSFIERYQAYCELEQTSFPRLIQN